MGSLHKNIQLMLELLKASFLVLNFSYYTLMTFLILSAILLSMLCWWCFLYSKSDLFQQLELVSELESDVQDTEETGKEWHVNFIAVKTQLVSFDWTSFNDISTIDVKMDGSVVFFNWYSLHA